jgi:L-ascorbate metabolism protein UlaG (beta-lactamase superfamily)
MIENIHWLGHAAFYIKAKDGTIIIFDPYKISKNAPQADIVLITHEHFDHCSQGDLEKVTKPDSIIVGPASVARKLSYQVKILKPGEKISVKAIEIEAVSSYNPNKNFHPRSEGNLGFIVTIDGIKVYHAGDTDLIPEMKGIKADIALLPVGGTYTMNAKEAAEAANLINPQTAIPMHFGSIVGSAKDAEDFKKLCKVEVRILKQE